MDIVVRRASYKDATDIMALCRNTILNVNVKDYTPEQVKVWSDRANDVDRWYAKIKEQYFLLAEQGSIVVGFASISDAGYLDFLFVHKDFQQMGIASLLYSEIEQFAKQNSFDKITSDVSLTAKAFFERKGFKVVKAQQVAVQDETLSNFLMEKNL